ncbi:MAG: tetratricopeptide repeat protein [Bacteroidales bacterium]|nr:tetratricopeptide repeat protein [Bacteroidales bacterium]MCF8404537.1 tetratricopeptide repeat protein [Bacteroidales bacterium]
MGKKKIAREIGKSSGSIYNFKHYLLNPFTLIFLYVFVLYGNTLNNKYSMDDHLVAIDNPLILEGIGAIPKIFISRYSETEGEFTYGYRPVVKATFALEQSLWGTNPFMSHLVNILLYALCCILLFLVLKRIFTPYHPYLPLLIILVFAAHPVHTEIVASLKNRDELLCLAGSLATLLFFIKHIDTKKWVYIGLGIFSFLFAGLSKQTNIPYLLLIPLTLYFFTTIKPGKLVFLTSLLLLVLIVVRFGPQLYLPPSFRPRRFFENNIRYEDIWTRTTTGFYILGFYLKKLVYPFPLLFYYGYNMIPIVKLSNPWVILSILFHGGIFIYSVVKIKTKTILPFAILFYLVSIAMFMNIVRPAMGIVAERFLLTPSIAFSIMVIILIFKLLKINPLLQDAASSKLNKPVIAVIILLIPYSALTINRNTVWKDHMSLYENDIKYLDNSVKANVLYAQKIKENLEKGLYSNTEKPEKINLAVKHYKRALELYPDYHVVWNNLATVYINFMGKKKEAIFCLEKAIELRPKKVKYYYNLARLYTNSKEYQKSSRCLLKAYQTDTTNTETIYRLAREYAEMAQYDSALYFNDKIKTLDEKSDLADINAGNFAMMQHDTLIAVKHWEAAINLNPDNIKLCDRLSNYYQMKNDLTKSQYFKNLAAKARSNKLPNN